MERQRRRVLYVLLYCLLYGVLFNLVFLRFNCVPSARGSSSNKNNAVAVVEATWSPHRHPQGNIVALPTERRRQPQRTKQLHLEGEDVEGEFILGVNSRHESSSFSTSPGHESTGKAPSSSISLSPRLETLRSRSTSALESDKTKDDEESSWWEILTSFWSNHNDDVDPVRRSINKFRRRRRRTQSMDDSYLFLNDGRPPRGGSMTMSPDDVNFTGHQFLHKQHQPQQQQTQEHNLQRDQQIHQDNYQLKPQYHEGSAPLAHLADTQQEQQPQLNEQLMPHNYQHHSTVPYDNDQYQQQGRIQEQAAKQRQEGACFVPPNVQLKHMSLALTVTSEWNRRLSNGINRFQNWSRKFTAPHLHHHHSFDNSLQYHSCSPDQNSQVVPPGGEQQQHQQQYHHAQEEQIDQHHGQRPINVHPSRIWHPPIPSTTTTAATHGHNNDFDAKNNEELTVFHARHPAEQPSRSSSSPALSKSCEGIHQWGPDMQTYLERLVDLFDLKPTAISGTKQDDSVNSGGGMIELPLAMIYLDRACSVETPRTLFQGYRQQMTVGGDNVFVSGARIGVVAPCPFCTPRTVHRLVLAALLLAIECVNGTQRMEEVCQRVIEEVSKSSVTTTSALLPSDLTSSQLLQMVRWMKAALGDAGLLVSVEEMNFWVESFEAIFGPVS